MACRNRSAESEPRKPHPHLPGLPTRCLPIGDTSLGCRQPHRPGAGRDRCPASWFRKLEMNDQIQIAVSVDILQCTEVSAVLLLRHMSTRPDNTAHVHLGGVEVVGRKWRWKSGHCWQIDRVRIAAGLDVDHYGSGGDFKCADVQDR